MDLQFHLEAFDFMMILTFMWTKKLTMHLPLGLPSHLSSLLPFLNDNARNKKGNRNKIQKVFWSWRKTSICKPQKPTKLDGNDTTLSHHPYILCHFANCAHHKTLNMHLACSYALMNKVVSFAHSSLTHRRQPTSAVFSSNKILQHNLNFSIPTQTQRFIPISSNPILSNPISSKI